MRNNPKQHSLTEDQQKAFDKIKNEVSKKDGSVVSLTGFAGSGKTFLIRHIAETLDSDFSNVVMLAPTHKAVEVLGRKTSRNVNTVHSAFGLRPKPDGKGGYKFVPTKEGKDDFVWGSLLIIDEASMIPHQLYEMVIDEQENSNLSVIFCGDPAQLPPVNENPSPALDHDGHMLENIVRQEKDNPTIQTSMEVRESDNPKQFSFSTKTKGDQGIDVVDDRSELIEKAIESFDTDVYRKKGDHVRILAYRNDVVETYNEICRELLYGDTGEQFIEGEWLVATDPWYGTNREFKAPKIQNSEEFVVKDKEPSSLYGFDTWVLEILSSPDSNEEPRYIEVLNRNEIPRYENKLDNLAEKAMNKPNKGDANEVWTTYYDYKECFAHVDYSYSMTVHRSQGSTFTKTFVDMEDINQCPNPNEIGKLKYVATTRASKKLVIFDG